MPPRKVSTRRRLGESDQFHGIEMFLNDDKQLEAMRNSLYVYHNETPRKSCKTQKNTELPSIRTDNNAKGPWKSPFITKVSSLLLYKHDGAETCKCGRSPYDGLERLPHVHHCEVLGPRTCMDCIRCSRVNRFKTAHSDSYASIKEANTCTLCAAKRLREQLQYTKYNQQKQQQRHLQRNGWLYKLQKSVPTKIKNGHSSLKEVRFSDVKVEPEKKLLPVMSPVDLHRRVMEKHKILKRAPTIIEKAASSPGASSSSYSPVSSLGDLQMAPPVVDAKRPEPYRRFSAGPDLLSSAFKDLEIAKLKRHSIMIIPTATIEEDGE